MKHSSAFFHSARRIARAFTLIELLLSVSILTIVLVTTTSLLNAALGQLRVAESRFGQFQEAQAIFDSMTRRLASCEINPYYGYVYPNGNTDAVPTGYSLQSELHFVCGNTGQGASSLLGGGAAFPTHSVFFQGTFGVTNDNALKGLGGMLNGWGYFVQFSDDTIDRASFLNGGTGPKPRFRYRLKELQVTAEQLEIYKSNFTNAPTLTANQLYKWFRTPAAKPELARSVGENIVALVISPLTPKNDGSRDLDTALAPNYRYDSRGYQLEGLNTLTERTKHRLPPVVRITLVALDEPSAEKLADESGANPPELGLGGLFQSALSYENDLKVLTETLQSKNLRYRVFTTTVRLRNARWNTTY